ncbi:unnamed protein product [Rotaria sordida]|uniref:CS domain-containing protein n=1 Tax=Rotaria sordida TaxID=392033 RepID=A0A814S456_9BILA|nr:unnamed protein product [Rotaria sordida]CAF1371448.1 unnamed protein product [Rotaria sordida]
MLLFLLDALKDSNDAIKLDETNIKAYIRKGVSLYNQDLKEEALQVFLRGLEFDFANEELKIWQNKCEKELAEQNPVTMIASIEKEKLTTNVTLVPPLPPAKIKHSFYQTDSIVTIQIPIKGLKKDQVHVYSTDTTINIHTKIPSSGQDYSLEVDLAYPVDSSRTNFNVTGSNIEIKLYKRQAIQWTSLDAQSTAAKAQSPVRHPMLLIAPHPLTSLEDVLSNAETIKFHNNIKYSIIVLHPGNVHDKELLITAMDSIEFECAGLWFVVYDQPLPISTDFILKTLKLIRESNHFISLSDIDVELLACVADGQELLWLNPGSEISINEILHLLKLHEWTVSMEGTIEQ